MDLPAALRLFSAKQIRSIHEAQTVPQIALWSGAVSSGKTIASLVAFLIRLANPPDRGLIVIVGRTLQTIERNVLDPLQENHLFAGWAAIHHTPGSSTAVINGRTVHLIGAHDARSEGRIRGSTIALAYVDEATLVPQPFWMMLLSRLRVPGARLFATTNPDGPQHWLRKDFILRAHEVGLRHWEFRLDDNPSLTSEYVARLKQQYTGLWYRRFIDGAWALAEGAIYTEFDEAVHVIDPFPIPDSWPTFISIDMGFTNPFLAQWWTQDPDGRLYMFRELYHTRRTVDEHARVILSQMTDRAGAWTEPKPTAIVCDHDAEARAVLERDLGMDTTAAHKTVADGIQAVQRRLKPAGDGKPRMFFFRGALIERDPELAAAKKPTCTVEEIPGYIWDTGRGKEAKEQPLKTNDHGCDGTRYLVAHVDGLGESQGITDVGGIGW
jgi:PBSX family phage terminase large subunit